MDKGKCSFAFWSYDRKMQVSCFLEVLKHHSRNVSCCQALLYLFPFEGFLGLNWCLSFTIFAHAHSPLQLHLDSKEKQENWDRDLVLSSLFEKPTLNTYCHTHTKCHFSDQTSRLIGKFKISVYFMKGFLSSPSNQKVSQYFISLERHALTFRTHPARVPGAAFKESDKANNNNNTHNNTNKSNPQLSTRSERSHKTGRKAQ